MNVLVQSEGQISRERFRLGVTLGGQGKEGGTVSDKSSFIALLWIKLDASSRHQLSDPPQETRHAS